MSAQDEEDLFAELAPSELEALVESAVASDDADAASGRKRLLEAARQTHRFEELVEAIAKAADLTPADVEPLLLKIDEPEAWDRGLHDAMHLLHFEGGPMTANAITGFVRIAPGHEFPMHDHVGEETVIILQGECRDHADGDLYGRGARIRSGPGYEHGLTVTSDIPLIYLAVVQQGIVVGGQVIGPDDPRA